MHTFASLPLATRARLVSHEIVLLRLHFYARDKFNLLRVDEIKKPKRMRKKKPKAKTKNRSHNNIAFAPHTYTLPTMRLDCRRNHERLIELGRLGTEYLYSGCRLVFESIAQNDYSPVQSQNIFDSVCRNRASRSRQSGCGSASSEHVFCRPSQWNINNFAVAAFHSSSFDEK